MNIYVGNLSYSATEEDLRQLFEEYGEVTASNIITDRETGRSRGFGFVEMPSAEQAQAAIDALNGTEWDRRTLTVNEARPRAERSDRGGGAGGGGRSRERRGGGGYGGGGGGGGRRY